MILSTVKRHEIFKLCTNFSRELLAFGFFESDKLDECKIICKTNEKYEQLPKNVDDRIIMKVAKRTSHFCLALTTMSPIYVSQNTTEGAVECAKIFNENFYAIEDLIETVKDENNVEEEKHQKSSTVIRKSKILSYEKSYQ